jgi:hypothetical protein
MKKLNKFLHLSLAERWLLIKAAFVVCVIRSGLWLLPFHVVLQFVSKEKLPTLKARKDNQNFIKKVAWAVKVTSRYVPSATCLTQSLAILALLNGQDQTVCLRIGVTKTESGQLQAHAWVECQGKIVHGSLAEMAPYVAMPPLGKGTL